MANKFDFGKVEKKVRTQLEASLVLMGRTAKTFFYDSFRKQGFEDKTVTKWAPRKKQDKRAGRAILVKSGDLRRLIRFDTVSKSNLSVRIASDLPYARIHNEGGVINKGEQFGKILSFNKKGRFTKQRTEKQRAKTSYQQKTKIGAHAINIPKRQFIGDSYQLNEKVKKIIITQLNKAFK